MSNSTASVVAPAVLSILDASKLSTTERKQAFDLAVQTCEAASLEGYREVINAAHKVGLTAGKATAKKHLLGKLRAMSPEDMFALAFSNEK